MMNTLEFDWTSILNWRLKAGSHKFPGPDGGTCLNEAAIVAAGFAYKKISSSDDCPPCFSRPFAGYAIWINDWLCDDNRHALLAPFVLRLSGTADDPAIEREREHFLALGILTRVVPHFIEDDAPTARALATARTWEQAYAVGVFGEAISYAAITQTIESALFVLNRFRRFRTVTMRAGEREAVRLLADAMQIGRQADPLATDAVAQRMESARHAARAKLMESAA
jgi:hypothetical protein